MARSPATKKNPQAPKPASSAQQQQQQRQGSQHHFEQLQDAPVPRQPSLAGKKPKQVVSADQQGVKSKVESGKGGLGGSDGDKRRNINGKPADADVKPGVKAMVALAAPGGSPAAANVPVAVAFKHKYGTRTAVSGKAPPLMLGAERRRPPTKAQPPAATTTSLAAAKQANNAPVVVAPNYKEPQTPAKPGRLTYAAVLGSPAGAAPRSPPAALPSPPPAVARPKPVIRRKAGSRFQSRAAKQKTDKYNSERREREEAARIEGGGEGSAQGAGKAPRRAVPYGSVLVSEDEFEAKAAAAAARDKVIEPAGGGRASRAHSRKMRAEQDGQKAAQPQH
ncbi:hypothetical protein JCM8208_003566 [Rhodotorula glutinis]